MDFGYTAEDGLLLPQTTIVAKDIVPEVNTITWSKRLNIDVINQEFEDYNQDEDCY
jgi:hypothetical protein